MTAGGRQTDVVVGIVVPVVDVEAVRIEVTYIDSVADAGQNLPIPVRGH
jgi:hypothetical protein